jgi:hypothetical protein
MGSADDVWLSLFVIGLFGMLYYLPVRFPNASRRSETMVLITATVLFFSVCNFFLGTNRSLAERTQPHTQAAAASLR